MIAIAVSRFNEEVTAQLLKSCQAALAAHGVPGPEAPAFHVPGGYELPWLVQELALSGRYEVVIALGCILKGDTAQNEHIARSTIQQLHAVSLKTRVPVILGVITPNTHAQAVARTKGSLDRGKEAAMTAIDVMKLRIALKGSHG